MPPFYLHNEFPNSGAVNKKTKYERTNFGYFTVSSQQATGMELSTISSMSSSTDHATTPIAGNSVPSLPSAEDGSLQQLAANGTEGKVSVAPEIRKIPSAEDIYEAIPTEGISIHRLAAKFASEIDDTNAQVFWQIVQAVGTIESNLVTRLPQRPSARLISEIIDDAKKPVPFTPTGKTNPKVSVVGELLEPIEISFSKPPELVRGAGNLRPPRLYRVFYENSATLSCFVTKHNHVRHRQEPDLRFQEDNAFQAIEPFVPSRDLAPPRIERHLKWTQKVDPSSYISAFNGYDHAVRRARLHYHKSTGHIGKRVSIAEISTSGLMAATVEATLRETVIWKWNGILGKEERSSTERSVQIPAWVHETARPHDGSSISVAQLSRSEADIRLSITELRLSNLKVPARKGNHYEWLACGAIPRSRIVRVMPYDGQQVHKKEGPRAVKSLKSTESWIFDWKMGIWRLADVQGETLERTTALKRKRSLDHQEEQHNDLQARDSKLQKQHHNQEIHQADRAKTLRCSACGQEMVHT